MLTCREIAQEIAQSFDILATSASDVPVRQRSQRAVFDHSWTLLSDFERCVLSRLALFQGGFDKRAAQEVADAPLTTLLALVSKSLIRRDENGRFDLHEAVRQYVRSHLEEDPQAKAAADRHCRYYLSLLRDRKRALQGSEQRDAIRELKAEIDNLRIAWEWAAENGFFTLIGQALRSLSWLCNVGVMYGAGEEQIKIVVQALRAWPESTETQRVLGLALAQQGLLIFRQGRFDLALERLAESLFILRPLEDPDPLTDPLVLAGVINHLNGELDISVVLLTEGLAAAQLSGDRFYGTYALYNLGYVASLQGRYEEGYEKMLTGLEQWRELGDPSSIALGLNYISLTAIELGCIGEARAYLQESIQLLTEVGDRWGLGTAYRHMGVAALAEGDGAGAYKYTQRSLDLFADITTGWDPALSLIYLAEAEALLGEREQAQATLCEALALTRDCHSTPLIMAALTRTARFQADTGRPEGAYLLAEAVVQHPATVYATRENAALIAAKIEEELSEDTLNALRKQASESTPSDLVELALNELNSLTPRRGAKTMIS